MGLRTFNVRGGSKRTTPVTRDEYYNHNIDIGAKVKLNGGEYGPPGSQGTLYPRIADFDNQLVDSPTLEIDGTYKASDFEAEYGDKTIGNISRLPKEAGATGVKPDAVSGVLDDEGNPYPSDPKKNNTAGIRMAAAAIEAAGGIANAMSRHQDFVTNNNMKIMQAQQEQMYVRAEAARAVLREGTKATDRKGQALINAVAQGQSATGDLAQTAMSNEDVYAAQNAMNIEINAMRSIYGLQSEQLAMETNNRLSRIDRNASIAQNIVGFAGRVAMAGT